MVTCNTVTYWISNLAADNFYYPNIHLTVKTGQSLSAWCSLGRKEPWVLAGAIEGTRSLRAVRRQKEQGILFRNLDIFKLL